MSPFFQLYHQPFNITVSALFHHSAANTSESSDSAISLDSGPGRNMGVRTDVLDGVTAGHGKFGGVYLVNVWDEEEQIVHTCCHLGSEPRR